MALRIGRRSVQADALLDRLGGRQGGLITAWNPASRPLGMVVNRRRQAGLRACLRRMPNVPAEGALRGWREEHVLAIADPRVLAALGRRFGQSAIVLLRRGRAPRLLML